MVKKILAESYFDETIPTNSNANKKKSYSEEIAPPPRSVPKSIQKQIVEYNIKSKYPEEYSIVIK